MIGRHEVVLSGILVVSVTGTGHSGVSKYIITMTKMYVSLLR
jgi:hypothetical protein